MTTLYRPVPITSAEQAEALPDETVATHTQFWAREKYDGEWRVEGDGYPHAAMVGWTALVPIEAEEETKSADHYRGPYVVRTRRTLTRLVTPWEES